MGAHATTLLLLTLASLVAAAINAMAGGGTFITFPALTGIAKLSEKAANVTSTVGLWPGYAASVVAARKALYALGRRTWLLYAGIGASGGVAGAILLLTTPTTAFTKAVPWLLAFSTILFATGPKIRGWALGTKGSAQRRGASSPPALAIVLLIAVYNGYFGAGGGVLLLAGLAVVMPGDVRRINLLKVLIQVTANASAIVVFLAAGIDWGIAAMMAGGSAVGGFLGMRLANRMPARVLQGVILAVGTTLTIAYLAKAYGWSDRTFVLLHTQTRGAPVTYFAGAGAAGAASAPGLSLPFLSPE
jgi:uncharacterized membrane protein YfcA